MSLESSVDSLLTPDSRLTTHDSYLRRHAIATTSYQTQLEEVQAAISAILSGAQSYSVAGRSMSRGDLATLDRMETRLRRLADRESAGGIRARGATPVD